jgi:ribonuclease T2
MKTTVAALAAVLAAAPAVQASLYGQSKDNHSCVLVPDYQSCSAKAKPNLTDSCCVETYGGLVLLTQVCQHRNVGPGQLGGEEASIDGKRWSAPGISGAAAWTLMMFRSPWP